MLSQVQNVTVMAIFVGLFEHRSDQYIHCADQKIQDGKQEERRASGLDQLGLRDERRC